MATAGRGRKKSYLHYDGQYHRPPPRSVVNELGEPVVEVLLQELDLRNALLEAVVEDLPGFLSQLVQQRLRVAEAAGDQLGRGARLGAVRADRGDDDEDAVFRKMPAVPHGYVAHIPHSQPVDEGDASLDPVDDPHASLVELDH